MAGIGILGGIPYKHLQETMQAEKAIISQLKLEQSAKEKKFDELMKLEQKIGNAILKQINLAVKSSREKNEKTAFKEGKLVLAYSKEVRQLLLRETELLKELLVEAKKEFFEEKGILDHNM